MTTILAKTYADRIEFLSDGGLIDVTTPDFQLMGKVRKVRGSLFAPLAVAGTGPKRYNDKIAAAVANWGAEYAGSVDATIDRVRDDLERQRQKGREVLQPSRILIAGISESKGPRIWEFVTTPSPDLAPWKLADRGQCIRLFGSQPTDAEIEMIDEATTLASLVPLMEVFRKRDRRGFNSHVDLTVIRPYGIENRRLREWPEDKIGDPMWTEEEWLAAQVISDGMGESINFRI